MSNLCVFVAHEQMSQTDPVNTLPDTGKVFIYFGWLVCSGLLVMLQFLVWDGFLLSLYADQSETLI